MVYGAVIPNYERKKKEEGSRGEGKGGNEE